MVNPAQHTQTSQEEKATKGADEAPHQADKARERCRCQIDKFTLGAKCSVFMQNKLCSIPTYKGKNVAEADVVRTRTPIQTDAMLQAAVLRLFVSSNLPKGLTDKAIS